MGIKMKNQFYSYLALIILTFQSCFAGFGEYMSSFDETLTGIALKTGREIETEIPFLEFAGVGGSLSNDNVINHEKLVFNVKKIIKRDEGVVLISKILNKYLKNMYSEKKMESYLKSHPFTYKNLEVKLFVYTKEGDDVFHPDIESVTLRDGVISYLTVSKSEKWFYKDESYTEEPYEETAKRLGVSQNH